MILKIWRHKIHDSIDKLEMYYVFKELLRNAFLCSIFDFLYVKVYIYVMMLYFRTSTGWMAWHGPSCWSFARRTFTGSCTQYTTEGSTCPASQISTCRHVCATAARDAGTHRGGGYGGQLVGCNAC